MPTEPGVVQTEDCYSMSNKDFKTKASAEDIRQEISRRIQCSDCPDCQASQAPIPRYIDPAENQGCNWTFDVIPGYVPGCEKLVIRITTEVMRDYDLLE